MTCDSLQKTSKDCDRPTNPISDEHDSSAGSLMKSFEIEMTGLDEQPWGVETGFLWLGNGPRPIASWTLPFFFQSMDLNIYALP